MKDSTRRKRTQYTNGQCKNLKRKLKKAKLVEKESKQAQT